MYTYPVASVIRNEISICSREKTSNLGKSYTLSVYVGGSGLQSSENEGNGISEIVNSNICRDRMLLDPMYYLK